MMRILPVLIVMAILTSCNDVPKYPENTDPSSSDFELFYKQFHSDVEYQLAHIVWPLPGRPDLLDSTTVYDGGSFYWQKEDWIPHVPYREDGDFTRSFEVVSDGMVNEVFEHKTMPIVVRRRFALTSDGWRLIYYAGPGN